MINVLDKGYVRLIDHMGTDLDVVNDARVSFNKESKEFGDRDAKLIRFLADRQEYSPFRHCVVKFEVYAPLMVCRQWYKYSVASLHREDQFAWNESSRRYVTEEPEFYVPAWRTAPDNKKQGSGGALEDKELAISFDHHMIKAVEEGVINYNWAIERGIAPEQARCFLPAYAMYVRWRWTASLNSVLFFLRERLEHKAQWEIHEYALAVKKLLLEIYPVSAGAVLDG